MGLFKKHRTWYIDYYFKGQRVREAVGPNKKAATDALSTRKTEILQGRYRWVQEKKSMPFEEFSPVYLRYSQINKRSWGRDETSLKHLEAFFKGKRLSAITPWLVEKYKTLRKAEKTRRKRNVKDSTINRELTTLKNLFTMAMKWGKAQTNPVREVKFFRVDEKMERILSPKEEIKLLAASADHLKPILITALHTGMRLREILNLSWDRVDFARGVIVIEKPKSGKIRKIPMNKILTSTLTSVKHSNGNSFFVFADPVTGKPYGSLKTSFRAAVRRAKIGHLRFHDLRHTFASRLVMSGVDIATVAELMGHASIKMTMRYAHPTPESRKKAVETLENYGHAESGDGHYLDTKAEIRKAAVAVTS
jgi:integrase